MKPIPLTENPLVLRTDFSNLSAWNNICALVRKPVGIFRFRANVDFLDDPEYDGLTPELLLGLIPNNYNHNFIVLVDQAALSLPEHPVLVMDLFENSGKVFRAIPSRVQAIENNLSIGNMDFDEFANAVDASGVFRGFPGEFDSKFPF